ncbi:MAG: hypothetical protein ABS46_10685 [Cytophagaceae bacterium SCN 52-12]|nr:MAG: hypothetical protein ABS46_10685 [Cytophagaceae bacterium SCN 52-12]
MKIGFSRVARDFGLAELGFLLAGVLIAAMAQEASGQGYRNQFVPYSTVGFGVGTSNYYGDMAPYRRVFPSTFKMMRWSVTGEYTRHFSPRFAARASLTWARIAGDDYLMNRSGRQAHQGFFIRNLHFRNDIKELSAVGIYKLVPDGRSYDRRPQFGAYLFAGVALFAHNPKARLPVPAGSQEKQRWVALQPLGTEGQGREGQDKLYSLVGFAIPVGVGLRYKINPKFDIGAELGFRFTTTDYLDDISKAYPDPAVWASGADPVQAQQMSFRSFEAQPARFPKKERTEILRKYLGLTEAEDPYGYLAGNPQLLTRGNNARQMDTYMTGTIKLVYVLGPSVKCPPLK